MKIIPKSQTKFEISTAPDQPGAMEVDQETFQGLLDGKLMFETTLDKVIPVSQDSPASDIARREQILTAIEAQRQIVLTASQHWRDKYYAGMTAEAERYRTECETAIREIERLKAL